MSTFTASTTPSTLDIVEDDADDELTSIKLIDSNTAGGTETISEPTTIIPVKSFRNPSPKPSAAVIATTTNQPKYEIIEESLRSNNTVTSMDDFQDGEEEVVSDYNEDAISSFNDEQVVYILNDENKTEINTREEDSMTQENVTQEQFELPTDVVPPKPTVVRVPRSTKAVKRGISPEVSGGAHVCHKCNNTYSTRTNLQRHLNSHDGSKPYVCPTCNKGFTQNGSLKQHLYIHTGERPFVCDICNRSFTQAKTLTFHMRRHTGEKPYNCLTCGQSFRQRDGLKRHVQIRHSEELSEIFSCNICEKVLKSQTALTNHRKRHENDGNTSEVSVVYYSSDDLKQEEKKSIV